MGAWTILRFFDAKLKTRQKKIKISHQIKQTDQDIKIKSPKMPSKLPPFLLVISYSQISNLFAQSFLLLTSLASFKYNIIM